MRVFNLRQSAETPKAPALVRPREEPIASIEHQQLTKPWNYADHIEEFSSV
jgi:hypothetical protein